jgi:dienelactone hydrolase
MACRIATDKIMHVIRVAILALLPWLLSGNAQAAVRQQFTVQTPSGAILVESFATGASEPRPPVIILSGSKGFGSSAYDEIGQTLSATGLDAYLVHVLSAADLDAITRFASARARIGYYEKRLSDWTAAVQGAVSYLNARPHHGGKVGMLGISLGAQIAAAAAVNSVDIGALVLVDGGFPNGYSQPIRSLPPLQLIWGGGDLVFPPSVGRELHRMAQGLGGPASLDVYEGEPHDFFLKSGTRQAHAAHQSAADFLVSQSSR